MVANNAELVATSPCIVDVPLICALPCTLNVDPGLDVPMPMRMPSLNVELATYKEGKLGLPTSSVVVATNAEEVVVPVIWTLPDCIERREPGVVVPMPRRRFVASTVKKSIESMTLVDE